MDNSTATQVPRPLIPDLIPEEDASRPLVETYFGCLYPRSRSFGRDPSFIGESRNEDGPIIKELCILDQLHGPLIREQDPEILELLQLP